MKRMLPSSLFDASSAKSLTRAIAFVAVCLAISCGSQRTPLNVVLIGVDTLRYDHVGCYGYKRETTPNIDRLASEGVLFEYVIAPSPWTLPSFATVFTSLHPSQHGAVRFQTSMRTSFPTLAELLRNQAYGTGGVINASYLKTQYKLDRGFDFYDMPPHEGRAADGTTSDALKWIDENMNQPFFIFVHYFDPHLPYSPPAPYDTLFDPDYKGLIGRVYDPKGLPIWRSRGFVKVRTLPAEHWDHVRSLYDGEIAFTDAAIGDLLEGLKERGLRKNTLVVFLSDHGEEFFEHGGLEHGHTLFDELIRVPLIFSLPGRLPKGVRIARQVRLLDVTPTILDLLGIGPAPGFEGASLKPLLTGSGTIAKSSGSLLPHEIAYAEAILYGTEKKSLTAYPWKLVYDVITGEKTCFNLAEDPGEHHDIGAVANQALGLLDATLFKTLKCVSDMWSVELVGGDREHTFDLQITCQVIPDWGLPELHRLVYDDRTIVDLADLKNVETDPYTITIEDLAVDEPVRLAVGPRRGDAPIRFNLSIDGQRATRHTFIGESLLNPVTMPFTQRFSPDDPTPKGEPEQRPEPPYILIWHSAGPYGGDTDMELDEEIKDDLRSLGYIQ